VTQITKISGKQLLSATGIVQEDDIIGALGALDGQSLAIRRPMKIVDVVGSETRDLMPRRTIERLHPDVIHAFFGNDVSNGLAIGRKPQATGKADFSTDARIRIDQPRRCRRRIQAEDGDFWDGTLIGGIGKLNPKDEMFAIGRE